MRENIAKDGAASSLGVSFFRENTRAWVVSVVTYNVGAIFCYFCGFNFIFRQPNKPMFTKIMFGTNVF